MNMLINKAVNGSGSDSGVSLVGAFTPLSSSSNLSDQDQLIMKNFTSDSDSFHSEVEEKMNEFLDDPSTYLLVTVTTVIIALVASNLVIYKKSFSNLLQRIIEQKQIRKLLMFSEDCFLFVFTALWLMACAQPYGMCVLWRWSVATYMKIRYGRLGDIASGLDSAGSVDFGEAKQIIKSLKILKGTCDIEEFRRRVEATACKRSSSGALIHKKFHQYLSITGGFYCWKPSNFDMNHHVRFVPGLSMDSPSLSESEVMELVSKFSNTAFDPQRAMWEILVVPRMHYSFEENVDPSKREDKFAILVRISHGIGDGFSFLKLVMRDMAGADAEDYVPPTKKSTSSWFYKIAVFCYLFFKSPRSFYTEMRLKDHSPLHNLDIKMTGEKVHVWSDPLRIEWLKELKKRMGAGMSTILLETLSGACRRYMTQQIGVPETLLPSTISTIIPVPAPNHPDNKLVNKFSIVMMPLSLKAGSAVERCRLIEQEARKMATSPDSYMNLFLMDLVAVFPVSLAKFFIINTQCTTVISNLPGPKKAISIWGYPLNDTMFWLPNVGSSGISVSYLSYEKRMRFGLALDTGVIPDGKIGADLLLTWMIDDLKALAASVNLPTDDMFLDSDSPVAHPDPDPIAEPESHPFDSKDIGVPVASAPEHSDNSSEVSSEDCGFGDDDGNSSDASFTTDEDQDQEDLKSSREELSENFSEQLEIKNNRKNSVHSQSFHCCETETKDVSHSQVDQRFLMTNSVTKYQCQCGDGDDSSSINISSSTSSCRSSSVGVVKLDHRNNRSSFNSKQHSCLNAGRS